MRLVTLNIRHGGGKRLAQIESFVKAQSPDVLVLTEYRDNANGALLRDALNSCGLQWQMVSSVGRVENGVLIASSQSFSAGTIGPERSPRLLRATFSSFEVVGVYFPQKEAKRLVFDQLLTQVLPSLHTCSALIGDFNTGLHFQDEKANTFYCVDGFTSLLSAGLVDSWRSRNLGVCEFSWYSRAGNGFRVDHVLSTPAFDQKIRSVAYLHNARLQGVTDHAGLSVEYEA